ncbi:MAG: hypothetical protein V7K77_25965 [Nostoc sp.]
MPSLSPSLRDAPRSLLPRSGTASLKIRVKFYIIHLVKVMVAIAP